MESVPRDLNLAGVRIDRDHRALTKLIEGVGRICTETAQPDCDRCPAQRYAACIAAVADVGGRVMVFLLDHFAYEERLMRLLPQTPRVHRHCLDHRGEHVEFSTRYNGFVSRLGSDSLLAGAQGLEELVIAWTREHALKYDEELTGLIRLYACA